ncbi:T9SS type A sorting domain-containing protein [Maribacter algarum]|uniref:T9SS type A sorting domain-containing protein n=1 Tax=Maribacter algarum (ex Zhang et al. 2020) TaxID=2578118 RepID=A0A5S3PNF8_9FLAO|nr:Ig-like domain-containing protein [Maribacter algarum]TMM55901.1 T9SS type A sorting domain-containing protein [Maribacter algarum]
MKTKLLLGKRKKYLFLLSSLLFLSAIPYYFAGSGLDNPQPIGSYLNGNFPGILPQGLPYEPIFPNLTFDSPLTFNELPTGNKIIVGQRDGKIFSFEKNPAVSTKNLMIDLSDKVGVVWDGGFLGLALHPQFGNAGKNYIYTWYTTEDANSNDFPNSYTTQSCDSEEYWGNFLILARYEANPTTLNIQESSEQIMLKLRMYGTTHRGGGLLFGDDGFLYLTTGDQTAFKKAQDIENNLDGGVLRLDVDMDNTKSHPPVRTMPDDHGFSDELTGNGYWIPNDNPFLSPTGENFEEYYSMGHRNPHRMTKDRETGTLYVGEIGGGRHEEINVIKKGSNYGWPLFEGFYESTFCVQNLYNNMPHEQPLLAFPRSEANAVIGGYVYRGNEVPELRGKYICADYGNGEEIFTVDINTGSYEQYGNFTSTNIISFGEDNQGELYILKQGTSSLFKITSKNTGFGNTPQLLSETGAFSDLINLTPTDGLIPYDLVESFWSDGAIKKRWMAIPNDGSHNTAAEKIAYSDVDDWNFPIGSVIVKHFELPINENNPSITKRLETRFSIKASDGNFYFVTYKWNDQQTDAELLTSGLDESIDITKANGSTTTQTWSYPSTIDCVTCHNPTTGGTLGTRARYLNKDFTYSETGRTANQLVTLSHLGILDQTITDTDANTILTSKSIDDASATLDEKARSYMDLNCAYCHRPGTGNRGDFDLRLNLDIVQTGLLTANPYLPLGIPNEKIVAPGNPSASIVYHRMNSTDPAIRMPPIAKNKIDANAVQLIDDWISQLDPDPCTDRIIMETYSNVPGKTIDELKSNVNFPAAPSAVDELNEFRIPINVDDDYGVRVKGLLKAPETGTYYFWVTGDDNVELSLSTDANELNKTRIAYHESWSFDGEWNKFPTQKSIGINLVAGQNYYIEALMNERGGGDNLSVGWRKPSNGNGAVPFQVIPCTAFDFFSGPPVVNVTGVSLDVNTLTLQEGESGTLTATVTPSEATDISVTWSSSNASIATVDTDGLVIGVIEGTATITVTTTDGGFIDTATISVEALPVPVTGVSVSPQSLTLLEGASQQLAANVIPADADDTSVSWSSSDDLVAMVSTNGSVTAVSVGTATITATTVDGGFSDTTLITVETAPVSVSGVSIENAPTSITVGLTESLTAVVSPSNATDNSVTWSSDNTSIATVDNNGLVTALAEGMATITVTTGDGGFTDTTVIDVVAYNPNSCTASGSILMERYDGIAGSAIANLLDAPNYPDNPSLSSELTIFEIQSNQGDNFGVRVSGYLCPPETGIYYFWIAGNNHTELNLSTSDDPADKVRLAHNEDYALSREWNKFPTQKSPGILLTKGNTYYIEALMKEAAFGDNLAVGWRKPSDGNGASPTGVVPGGVLSPVVRANVPVTGVSLLPSNLSLAEGETSTLSLSVSPSNATDNSVTWSSNNTSIATVDNNGLVTALAEGMATITVTTGDGGFTDTTVIDVVAYNPNSCTASGSILMERYDGIAGSAIANLLDAPNYPDNPSLSSELTTFEIQSNQGDNFGVRVSGYLCPPETGIYYFWIAGNNHTELNLSTSDDPADKVRLAHNEDYALSREWNKFPTQKSPGILLTMGNTYYIEALMKEAAFGDNLAVGWRKPSDGNGASPTGVVPGGVLSPVVRANVPVTGVSLLPSNLSLAEGETSTLSLSVSPSNATDNSVTWSSNNTSIATVDNNGLVTALAEGMATITVTTGDGGFTDTTVIDVVAYNPNSCTASGSILMERYDGIAGSAIANLLDAPNYPDSPSISAELTEFETPRNMGDNFGVRVSGYLCPPETGIYYFWIAGNNHTELNLSTSDDPVDKVRLAHNEDYALNREWNKFPTQKSQGILLTKGNNYYIEALMKEAAFGDNLAVGWRKPSDGNGASPTEVIPGNVMSPVINSSQSLLVDISDLVFNDKPSLTISPNPASTEVQVILNNLEEEGSEIEYTIYSISGTQVMHLRGGWNEIIDVSRLAAGAYQIVVRSGAWSDSKKLIIR